MKYQGEANHVPAPHPQPKQTYHEPKQTYHPQPKQTYHPQPKQTYHEPKQTYHKPEQTYHEPEPTYKPEPTYHREPKKTYQGPEPKPQRTFNRQPKKLRNPPPNPHESSRNVEHTTRDIPQIAHMPFAKRTSRARGVPTQSAPQKVAFFSKKARQTPHNKDLTSHIVQAPSGFHKV